MKFVRIILLLPLFALVAPTQGKTIKPAATSGYESLWKQVDKAIEQDLPQSALTAVRQIYAKALSETNDGQMLAAALTAYQLNDEVAPDSGAVHLAALEAAAAREERPAVKTLWQCAVGRVLLQQYSDTAATRRGRELLRHALDDMDALAAARTADYLPLFTIGKDSRLFHNDLLSVVGQAVLAAHHLTDAEQRDLADRLTNYYSAKGNREGALLFALELADRGKSEEERRTTLRHIAADYKDLNLNVETYIRLVETDDPALTSRECTDSLHLAEAREGLRLYGSERRADVLRNAITRIEQAEASLKLPDATVYPTDTLTVRFEAKNVHSLTFQIYRLHDVTAADQRLRDRSDKAFAKLKKTQVQNHKYECPVAPAYHTHRDSLRIAINEPGVYLVRLRADGKNTDETVVFCSRVLPITLVATGGTSYVRLVDRRSGAPLRGGRVVAYSNDGEKPKQLAAFEADSTGEIVLTRSTIAARRAPLTYFATVDNDAYSTAFDVSYITSRPSSSTPRATTRLRLFSDRAIYRPGQTLHFGGIAYTQQGDNVEATINTEVKVTLYNANGERVADTSCRTDSFGSISGDFSLPETCLPGYFRLSSNRFGGSLSVRVEEYKRPTFTVEMNASTAGYTFGDTARITGVAKTLSGIPVADARVAYVVRRNCYSIYRTSLDSDETQGEQRGETVTDSAGHFVISFSIDTLSLTADDVRFAHSIVFSYVINADVTASNGESIAASQSLSVGRRRGTIELQWPATVCKEFSTKAEAALLDAEGRTLPTDLALQVEKDGHAVFKFSMESGEKCLLDTLRALPSGRYTVIATCDEADTVRRAFTLFSEQDVRLADTTPFFHYERTTAQGDAATVVIGSSFRDVALFYNLVASDGRRLESRIVQFSDSLLRFPIKFHDEMGESCMVNFAFVKGGKLYETGVRLSRPRPEKQLQVRWETFRSRLTPGQDETWTLRITHPDGRPADALLMARLYDASLDAFADAPWSFNLSFLRYPAEAWWEEIYMSPLYLNVREAIRLKKVPELDFTTWQARYFNYYAASGASRFGGLRRRYAQATAYSMSDRYAGVETMALYETATADAATLATPQVSRSAANAAEAKGTRGATDEMASAALSAVTPRTNFAETALFTTALRTDANGRVSLTFTLPQSLTSWRCSALAHTRTMDYGLADTTAVAVRLFSVQPALPRFVRRGDRVSLPVTLRNLFSTAESGTVRLTLTDAATGKTLLTLTDRFKVNAGGEVTKNFDFTANFTAAALVCRVVAASENYSDGEEHYLPVLTDRVLVTRSIPFSLREAGVTHLRIDTLFTGGRLAEDRRLTVELSSNPAWYAVAALPSLATITGESAVDNATRYYAVTLAHHIAAQNPQLDSLFMASDPSKWAAVLSRNPDLKQTLLAETPWTATAETEADRIAALHRLFDKNAVAAERSTALDRLRALQQADGSWSWYPGMRGNAYITADVSLLLARLESLCGDKEAGMLLDRAMKFLDKEMAEDVTQMKKKNAVITVGETHLRYLYIRALRGEKPDKIANFLIEHFAVVPHAASMYDKALFAVVLARAGEKQRATETLQSLTEHTVVSPAMGRYFDTNRANPTSRRNGLGWNFYRIPTQTVAIEALALTASPTNIAVADEMRLWLMQSRRTQLWPTSRAAADAVFALLIPTSTSSKIVSLQDKTAPVLYTLGSQAEITAFNAPSQATGRGTVGYYCHTFTDTKSLAASQLTLRKSSDGPSWGSVVAQYTVPQTAATASAAGLSISRSYEVKRGGRWTEITDGMDVFVGEHVRQVLTLTADRDYDFVSIRAARAACLAPTTPLSGYTWNAGLGLYRAVHDTSTDFFADHMAKGRYIVTEEYLTDRAGRYACGASRIQSVYAPEFVGQTSAHTVLTTK